MIGKLIESLRAKLRGKIERYRTRFPGGRYMTEYAARESRQVLAARASGELERIFYSHEQRVAHKWHHYLAIYERELAPFRVGFVDRKGARRPLRYLEIGVSKGGSLQLWKKFFSNDTIIFGVDINPDCKLIDDEGINVRIGSQADPKFLQDVVAEMGGVDVVLDDGSHIASHQRVSFDVLFPLLADGGLYMVEDLQTSYWRAWEGGYRRKGTFVEFVKSLIDDMHGWYHERAPQFEGARSEISRIQMYDGLVVIEKRSHGPPFHIMVGGSQCEA